VNKNISQPNDEITRVFNDPDAVTDAIRAGIKSALLQHKKMGNPICVWRDEKVVWIEAKDINIPKNF